MENIRIEISKLKEIASKINVAIEKNKLNPKAGWIEIKSLSSDKLSLEISNFDYYLKIVIPIVCENYSEENSIHATIAADTFIPLVSKLDDDFVYLSERFNSLIFTTSSSEYNFPIIKEMGKVKNIDIIKFKNGEYDNLEVYDQIGKNLYSVFDINSKGLLNSLFSKDIQQYIYLDNKGAITFTENIYINDFENYNDNEYKFLLNNSQARLLKIFDSFDHITIKVEKNTSYESSFKVGFFATSDYSLSLIYVVQSKQLTDKFPSIRLRNLASVVSNTHAIVDKKKFEKALQRLMVFDKKWDKTDMSYSKIVFSKTSLKLVSIKSKNYEVIDYIKYENTGDHESIIRFEDLMNQIKAAQGKELDISYGDSPAIVINSIGLKQLIPEVQVIGRV